jgi:hypothetical protein
MDLLLLAARVAQNPGLPAEAPPRVVSQEQQSQQEQVGYIKHEKGKGYCVKSEKNSDWSGGCYPSKGEAEKRLNQVEMFKHMKKGAVTPEDVVHDLRLIATRLSNSNAPDIRVVMSDLRSVLAGITYKSAPEYKSVESLVQYLMDDDKTEFSHDDLSALNYRLTTPVGEIKKELESYGLKLLNRPTEKKPRGFNSPDNDRWFGPGSEKTHGGSGFSNVE